ncbi:Uncharacterised protein [Legionella steigerwaltii]|uniref:Uncharacterized protein n=1 Tax=Legionella steigerwaltii TaxID=460 RepID=A0A378L9N4_9GAMM|nr:hypothetical protein [Legionella steigerwaltii]KTD80791.1 hypothetical protein Lstg_0018 [Legionella steigerwaltii]STY23523.1 Uncharacterised protein [Legionella steigerwaltii]
MKIINKSVSLILCSLSMTAMASTSNDSLYEKLYRLAEKVYYIEYSLSTEQRKMTEELSNQIEAVISLPNDVTCGNKTEVFKEAYKWSYSVDGLNDSASEAEQFATQVTAQSCPAAYFKIFKPSYKFAYASDGMNKTKSEAKKTATKISDYEASKFYAKNSLQCYIDNYTFAYSSGGMNKSRSEAESFANKQCLD